MKTVFLFAMIVSCPLWLAFAQSIGITSGLQLVECPPGGIPEQEACGEAINGGCDMEPGTEYFEPIECGTTICGTAWANWGLRNTDWYTLTLTETVMLAISGEAEFPFELAIIVPGDPDPCVEFTVLGIVQAAEGELFTLQVRVNYEEVWIRAGDSGFDGNPCGDDDNDYYITVDCQPCEDFITIEIETDAYPEETSWELIERESGTVVASAGPLSDGYTLHTWQVFADRTLCYDWYIYDTYGDGLCCYWGHCGYYEVYGFDCELLCNGDEFGYVDVCPDIGTCLPQTGACCIDNICEFTSEEQPCLEAGGNWYVGEICPEFQCPMGACCIDNVCEFTSEEQPCLNAGGTWYEGETCPEFQCPIDPCEDAIWHNGTPTRGGYASQCDPAFQFYATPTDDFILPGEPGQDLIDITGVVAWFHHWNADPRATPADYDGVTVTIYNDAGGVPGGNPVEGDPDCTVAGDYVFHRYYEPGQFLYLEEFTDVWRLQFEISDLTLNSGITYWLTIQPVMQFDPYGQSGNTPSDQQTGSLPMLWWGWYWVVVLDSDISFCINGTLPPCDYIPGDCDANGIPLELNDIMTMIGMYRGTVMPPYECYCPPHGDNFTPTADPNGNCVANELGDVVTEIAAYRGSDTASGCPDCPGLRRLLPGGDDQPVQAPSLKSKTRIRKPSGVD